MQTLHHERSDGKQSVFRMVKFKGHILQFVAQHIHQSPLSRCFASKTLLMQLLIYNINFKVHPICPWIQVIFFFLLLPESLKWIRVRSSHQPRRLPVPFLSLLWRGHPLLFQTWQLPLLLLTSTSCRLPLCAPPRRDVSLFSSPKRGGYSDDSHRLKGADDSVWWGGRGGTLNTVPNVFILRP